VTGRRAVFVDRDGVVNELAPDPATGIPQSPLRADDISLIPGAADALRRLAVAGLLLVGVSNQPAAAKGTVSVAAIDAVQRRVLALLAAEGVCFDAFRLCLHHPDGVVPALRAGCACRKPAPGMLLDAARDLGIDLSASWMVGDSDDDVAAGAAAGCRTVLVEHPPSARRRRGASEPDAVAADLRGAAELLLARASG